MSISWIGELPIASHKLCAAACTITVILISYLVYSRLTRRKQKVFPRDTVVVHKFESTPFIPTLSPFTLKLETYLRIAKIPYETACSGAMSSKGKKPWISYQGENVADSQFCIEYLNEKFAVNLNHGLTEQDKACSRILRLMVEDHLYFIVLLYRWVYNYRENRIKFLRMGAPRFLLWIIHRGLEKQTRAVGIGRHSHPEVDHIGEADLRALSQLLGEKPYFFGDSPVEEDCAIFGILSLLVYFDTTRGKLSEVLKEKLPNLTQYCERMKELAWPDWDELVKSRQIILQEKLTSFF